MLKVPTNEAGHLTIGGVDALQLAQEYQTPVIAYDVTAIKQQLRDFKKAFVKAGVPFHVSYASKAFSALAMYRLVANEGVGCDVVSGGELYAALKGGMPAEMIEFHGNNKTPEELEMAVEEKIGRIVIDNFQEIKFLDKILRKHHTTMKVQLRITPGVEAETHSYISTGQANSKFGFDIISGQARKALEMLIANPRVEVEGLHCHIGSQIFGTAGFVMAVKKMVQMMKQWKDELGFVTKELNIGGGFGIRYTDQDQVIDTEQFSHDILGAVKDETQRQGLDMPEIWIEPGRAVAGEAATTLYTVGSRKDVDGVCHFLAVDGGMGDNIRPALYQAKYEAFLAKAPQALNEQIVTVVGKYCESGDILVKDCPLPNTQPGDILAIPSTGAYGYTMASNYNRNGRPAVVFCENGKSQLVVRRETFADMLAYEILPEE